MEFVLFIVVVYLFIRGILTDRWRREEKQESQQLFAALTARVHALEQQPKLQQQVIIRVPEQPAPSVAPPAPVPETRPVASPPPVMPLKPVVLPPPVTPAAPVRLPETPAAVPVSSVEKPAVPVTPRPFMPATPPPVVPPVRPAAPVQPSGSVLFQGQIAKSRSGLELPKLKKPGVSFTESIGTNWLPKLGITLLVLGVAYLGAASWQRVSPFWRVVIFFAVGLGTLAGGIFTEKKEKYKVLGRVLIGGGWAITFFTTYGMRHVPGIQIMASDVADLILMLLVAGAMVWHTLQYDSQLVTGASFLLGFLAIGTSHETPLSATAGIVLAIGLVILVVRRKWFELEIFGILASYLNHLFWFYQLFDKQGHGPFPQFTSSVILMTCYWLIFRASYLVRTVANKRQESLSTIAALMNPILFLGVMKYQSFHPPAWAFWPLLIMGGIEFTLGQLPLSRRRVAPFQVLSSLGVTLMVAAVPCRYAGTHTLELLWLAGAEAFLLAGILTREKMFRYFGGIISFLVAAYVFVWPTGIAGLAGKVLSAEPRHDTQLGIIFAVIAAVFYVNSHIIGRRWKDLFSNEFEQQALQALSFMASVFAVGAIYASVPANRVAIVLAVLFTVLCWVGQQFSIPVLLYEAHWITAVAILDACVTSQIQMSLGRSTREPLIILGIVAALTYLSARFIQRAEYAASDPLAIGYRWAATALLALLIWWQAPLWLVPVYWVGLGLAVSGVGHLLKRNEFKWQGLVLALLSFASTLVNNFTLSTIYHGLSYRLISVALVAAGVYVMALWSPGERVRPIYSWLGSFLLSWLAWYELQPNNVALAWSILGLVLFEIGYERAAVHLRIQGYVALVSSFIRILVANVNTLPEATLFSLATFLIVLLAVIYFWVFWRLHSQARKIEPTEARLEHIIAALGTATVAVLVHFELLPDSVAVGYAALAAVLLLAAWLLDLKIFLYQGLIMVGATAFRLAMRNFYNLQSSLTSDFTSSIIAIAILALSLPVAFRVRSVERTRNGFGTVLDRPEQPLFFITVGLMTVLLYIRMQGIMVTLSWSIEGLVIILAAFFARERNFIRTGLGLLLLCGGKIFLDIRHAQDATVRALTMIGVAILFLAAGYLFARNRDALREYL